MSLTYDQKSEIRMAFDEAFVAPERRCSMRVKHIVSAEIYEWKRGKQGMPFIVSVEDFSPMGVGIIHGTALPVGGQYLIKVPRPKWGELIVKMTVVRCAQPEKGDFRIGLEISSVLDQAQLVKSVRTLPGSRVTTRLTKILLLLLGISGLGLSLLID